MNTHKTKTFISAFMFLIMLISGGVINAQATGLNEDKPFAEAHIVLQLGDGDPEVQARVISVANNLIKHYGGPDFVDIEIVAYGPGISLLYPSNPAMDRVKSLLANEVKLVGCMNTVETITRTTGKKPALLPETVPVKTGVAYLVEKAGQGYVVIRP